MRPYCILLPQPTLTLYEGGSGFGCPLLLKEHKIPQVPCSVPGSLQPPGKRVQQACRRPEPGSLRNAAVEGSAPALSRRKHAHAVQVHCVEGGCSALGCHLHSRQDPRGGVPPPGSCCFVCTLRMCNLAKRRLRPGH